MKKTLVLGATGGTGMAIAGELVKRGIPAVLFGRSMDKLERTKTELGGSPLLELHAGDVFRAEDVAAAAAGTEIVFHAVSVSYDKMADQLIMGRAVLEGVERSGAKLAVVDGIYPYGRRRSPEPIGEDFPKNPHTRKGRVKLEFERLLFDPRYAGIPKLIARLPDYYGPSMNAGSYLGPTLEGIAAGKTTIFAGSMRVPREFVYLPDAAAMIVELALRGEAYGQNWHIPSAGPISGHELVKIAQSAAGVKRPVLPLGRASLSAIGLFAPVMKEIVEMLYLTEEPLLLSGAKYEALIGPIPATPYAQGVRETIEAMRARAAAKA
ncbi:NAD-dependent epimerase/dehydratase family protein [Saccharibacillus sp. CPCC 101409]|uniref:NAD-dependent epimerase/dehydratase family protein n=1 Tax=Saccharibacillus sp. CPCC 101409 TaxID=3058041 RepID=UPI0026727732|nr:NAD-dependent epimerase/dehydratase family protein [Saccharibacillus sp. CPCC 101409]MDO3411631.1 NAD-dependent epimerase/dehydratase family protein [Saccharibacillus sp. CPCC 101409]